jgi:imidazolonepropionase-like amidohydrolase
MQVHQSSRATAVEALHRSTLAPAAILGLPMGRLEAGQPASFIEVEFSTAADTVEAVIQSLMPSDIDQPARTVNRATVAGKTVFQRSGIHA